jgi:hypothetical protein
MAYINIFNKWQDNDMNSVYKCNCCCLLQFSYAWVPPGFLGGGNQNVCLTDLRQSQFKITPHLSQKTMHITFPADGCVLNFFLLGESECCHSMDCLLVSGSYSYTAVHQEIYNKWGPMVLHYCGIGSSTKPARIMLSARKGWLVWV